MAVQSSVRRRYPLRYWMLVAVMVGIPRFLNFDPRSKTQDFGLYNPWSLSQIALMLLCAVALAAVSLSSRKAINLRKINFHHWFWVGLVSICILASIVNPQDKLLVSLYWLFEWVVCYLLLASAYTRAPAVEAPAFLREVAMKLVNISIGAVLLALVVYPPLAYVSAAEFTSGTVNRLGGNVVQSNRLGFLACVGVLHSVIYLRGTKRFLFITFYSIVLFFTFSRGSWIGLAIALVICVFMYPSKIVRAIGFVCICFTVAVASMLSDKLMSILERGQGSSNLETLSGRFLVWATDWQAFRLRPWIGYGFVDGPKQILSQLYLSNYWIPPNCHNEFLQALVTGGIVCGVMIMFLYLIVCYRFIRLMFGNPKNLDVLFFGLVFLEVMTFAPLAPVLMAEKLQVGVMFLICFLAAFDALPKWTRLQEQARAAAFAPSNPRS